MIDVIEDAAFLDKGFGTWEPVLFPVTLTVFFRVVAINDCNE